MTLSKRSFAALFLRTSSIIPRIIAVFVQCQFYRPPFVKSLYICKKADSVWLLYETNKIGFEIGWKFYIRFSAIFGVLRRSVLCFFKNYSKTPVLGRSPSVFRVWDLLLHLENRCFQATKKARNIGLFRWRSKLLHLFGWGGRIWTLEITESESAALPLGDTPMYWLIQLYYYTTLQIKSQAFALIFIF